VEEDILNNQPCGAGREAPTRSRMTIFATKREKEAEDASVRERRTRLFATKREKEEGGGRVYSR